MQILMKDQRGFDIHYVLIEIKLIKDQDQCLVDFQFTFPPIGNANYVVKFNSQQIQNNQEFYTDSNGYTHVKRRYYPDRAAPTIDEDIADYNDNAPRNYYPVTHSIFIEDEISNRWMVVMNEHSQGGSSLSEGSIELMFNRREPDHDVLGLYESLNDGEFERTRSKFLIAFPRSREQTFDLVKKNYYLRENPLQYSFSTDFAIDSQNIIPTSKFED